MLRIIQIAYVFALHLLFYRLSSRLRQKNFGERFRLALERLGLVFVKLGQALATRKFFSPASQSEIEKLWDASRPLPFGTIRGIVESEIGEPIDQYFDNFDETPYASASIAQTHVAVRRGNKVMVKVRRPGVLKCVRQDLRIARRLIAIGALVSRRVWCIKSARIPEQVEAWLLEEADFRNEEKNIAFFRSGFDTDLLVVPEVEFASEQVLIETFLEGVPCNRWDERYRKDGYDPQASARALLTETFGPPFQGVPVPVHADPHPANLIIMKGGRMGIVDFGLVGRISQREIDLHNDCVFAIYAQNVERAVEALLLVSNYSFPNEKKERAFVRAVARFVKECRTQPFDYWLLEMGAIVMRHGIPAPAVMALLCRFGVLGNSVVQMFFPGLSTIDLVGEQIRAGMRKQMLNRIANIDPVPLLYELTLRAEQLPRDAAEAVRHPLETLAEAVETVFGPLRAKSA